MLANQTKNIAVIGAGIAGGACAQALSRAGHAVHVFDKSRGPGGRLATRRVEWVDRRGLAWTTRLDHGAVCVTARSAAFQTFVDQAVEAGCLAEWTPVLAASSRLPDLHDLPDLPHQSDRLYVPVPELPMLCRHLLEGVATTWSVTVDRLHEGPRGWQVESGGECHGVPFDAVVLAVPPAQAAPLIVAHRPDWALHASSARMQPCWTLMGVADAPQSALAWDVARPASDTLDWVLRNDTRPGRERVQGLAHWVAHARADWSRRHLEQPAAWVQAQLQAALSAVVGQPVDWLHCAVHRWRYALPEAHSIGTAESCWWDAALGLGACGDFLGGCGVEGAWSSARSLSAAMLQAPDALQSSDARLGPVGARMPFHHEAST